MINLVYIGNQLKERKRTVTTIEVLGPLLETEGYQVVYASNKRNKLLRLLHMMVVVAKHRRTTDYVLIDTYSTLNFYYAFLISQLCRIFKLKYIPILHGGNLPNRLEHTPVLSRAIFNWAYKNVTPSQYLVSAFKAYGYTNLISIPNAIFIEQYPFQERSFDVIHLLWVRSFAEIYNPLLAVAILKQLIEKGLEARLTMVGPDKDGSLEKTKAYAKSLGVNVTFTGKLSKQDWIKLSAHHNVFMNTTNFDNMPVSVMEAMALGLPVVSTHVGGMPFLIQHEVDGVLVPPNDVWGFVDAIVWLRNNYGNTKKVTLNARKKVEQYDWARVKKIWKGLLR